MKWVVKGVGVKLYQFIIISILIFACISCETIDIPANRFHIPESMGKFKGNLNFRYTGATAVDIDARLATENSFTSVSTVGGGMDFGLTNSLDTYFNIGLEIFSQVPASAGIKFQFLGEPQSSAKQGNFSAAILAGLLYGETDLSDENERTKMNSFGQEVTALAGYRITPNFLLYGGPYYSEYKARIKSTFAFKRALKYGRDHGYSLGFKVNHGDFYMIVEASRSNIDWDSVERNRNYFGLSLGVSSR